VPPKSSDVRYTERLRLEPIGPEHLDALRTIHSDPAVLEWYGEYSDERLSQMATDWRDRWTTDGAHKWIAYDKGSGELIGRGGLSFVPVDGAMRWELGWALRGSLWGHGYATEIGRAGLSLAFDELGTDEVVAFTEPHNARSRAVMERLAMTYVRDFDQDGEHFVLYVIGRG
jgi:[ribosomal protein S5]-alanine N-acetyltransferase